MATSTTGDGYEMPGHAPRWLVLTGRLHCHQRDRMRPAAPLGTLLRSRCRFGYVVDRIGCGRQARANGVVAGARGHQPIRRDPIRALAAARLSPCPNRILPSVGPGEPTPLCVLRRTLHVCALARHHTRRANPERSGGTGTKPLHGDRRWESGRRETRD
jgi:hypothetical protein